MARGSRLVSSEKRKDNGVQLAWSSQSLAPEGPELERAFKAHHNRVFQVAYRVTGNSSDAEDVLQNIFIRLMKRSTLPSRSDELGSYLHRAAVNASIDLLRSRKPSRRIPLEDIAVRLAEDDESSPETEQRGKELADWLRSAVSRLSPQAAEIFSLRYLEGYKNLEIAEMVQTSPGVVAVVLHRARQRLREELEKFLGEKI